MSNFYHKIAAIIISTALLAGCNTTPVQNSSSSEPPAPAPKQAEPVTVTMFGNWSDNESDIARNLQAAISKAYPEITIEYEAFPTGANAYMDELKRRLAHDKDADLFITADCDLWNSGELLDITDQEFVGKYSVATMQRLSGDGSVYFLPGIGDVVCYVYNAEQIAEVPKTLSDLERITKAVKDAGGHPFIVPYEQTQPLLIKALAASYLSSPDGQMWLEEYSMGKAAMIGNKSIEYVWEMAQRMIDNGVLTKEDMLFAESRRTSMLAEELGGMSTITSSLIDFLNNTKKEDSRFNLIPLLGETPESMTVFSAPTCYFAASARLGEPDNEAKKDAVLKILDFISTQEGQTTIKGNSPLANSYINGLRLPLDEKYKSVSDTLLGGSFGPMPVFGRGVEAVIGESFGKMLRGEMTAKEAMSACDEQNASYTVQTKIADKVEVLGTAADEFPWTFRSSRIGELAVTNFAADSMREQAKTDFALELGTAVRGEFFKGEITTADISSVVRVDKKLYAADVTGQQIWDIIEQGVQKSNSSWFVVVSGFKYSYQPAKGDVPGKLLTLSQEDGTPIDMAKTYKVAVSENQMMEVANVYTFFGAKAQEVPGTLREAVTNKIKRESTISPKIDGRITAI